MVSDAALSFGQGVLQGMGPGLELRSRHKYAETERLAIKKKLNTLQIY